MNYQEHDLTQLISHSDYKQQTQIRLYATPLRDALCLSCSLFFFFFSIVFGVVVVLVTQISSLVVISEI